MAHVQAVAPVCTSLNPTLKYAVSPGASVTGAGTMLSKSSPPPRTTVVGSAAPVSATRRRPG
jgi:hypothetical protein